MLETVFKVAGWAMVLTPITVFLVISTHMIKGAAKDDEIIMALTMLGLALFGVGALILVLFYVIGFTFD